jgi:hypothetical protein
MTSVNRVTIVRDYYYFNRLYAIISDYFRLFPIILLQNRKRLYAIIPKDDNFHYCTTIISLIFSTYIIAIMHDYVHYFYRKLLYVLFHLR